MTPDLDVFKDALTTAVAPWNLALTSEQVRRMADHYAAMVETNNSFNLTRITDPVEAAVKHYADSLALVAWANAEKIEIRRVLDIGTGAGFPAVPLAIARPDWQVTAIDGTRKKVDFITRTAATLELRNLTIVHTHSTHWEANETFDIVTARALGATAVCLEAAKRFAARSARVVLFKTPDSNEGEPQTNSIPASRSKRAKRGSFDYELRIVGLCIRRVLAIHSVR